MERTEYLLGLFYSDEDEVVYNKIKFSRDLDEKKKPTLQMLPFRFLGPVFLTAASSGEEKWRIELIEASLSLYDRSPGEVDILQSFFNLNSTLTSDEGNTNLFALIGSPYTEDIKVIYNKIISYIHPSIVQGKTVSEGFQGSNFNFINFINNELNRGLDLIEYYLGSSRKVYWEEGHNFYCIALIERFLTGNDKKTYLYTFNKNSMLKREFLTSFPSYYVMALLPGYYESLIYETLEIFDKKGIFPHLRKIKLNFKEKKVVYIEEFSMHNGEIRSLGVVLIPNLRDIRINANISNYRKILRKNLDGNKDIDNFLTTINVNFAFERWGINSEEESNALNKILDNPN